MKWLQKITNLPLLVKGVLTAEDGEQNPKLNNIKLYLHFFTSFMCVLLSLSAARMAVQTGAASIIVFNHGPR